MKRDVYAKMRASGMTYQSIANEFGVSRQAVFSSIRCGEKTDGPYEYSGTKLVAYQQIKDWLTENHCSVNKLEKMTGCSLRLALRHKTVSSKQAKKISLVTGISEESILSA